MLETQGEPNDGRLRLLKLAIGYLAVKAKMEEDEYGGFFDPDSDVPAGEATGPKPRTRKRAKRGTDPDPAAGARDAPDFSGFPDFGGPGGGSDEEGIGFADSGRNH